MGQWPRATPTPAATLHSLGSPSGAEWLPTLFFVGLALYAVSLWSEPGPQLMAVILWYLLSWIAVLTWGLWTVLLAVRAARRRSLPRPRNLVFWATPVALGVVVATVTCTGASFRARFELSRPAMDDLAAEVVSAHDGTAFSDGLVGLYSVSAIEKFPGGMRFRTSATGFDDHVGFAYSPRAEPPHLSEDTYEHISGPWYLWYQSW